VSDDEGSFDSQGGPQWWTRAMKRRRRESWQVREPGVLVTREV